MLTINDIEFDIDDLLKRHAGNEQEIIKEVQQKTGISFSSAKTLVENYKNNPDLNSAIHIEPEVKKGKITTYKIGIILFYVIACTIFAVNVIIQKGRYNNANVPVLVKPTMTTNAEYSPAPTLLKITPPVTVEKTAEPTITPEIVTVKKTKKPKATPKKTKKPKKKSKKEIIKRAIKNVIDSDNLETFNYVPQNNFSLIKFKGTDNLTNNMIIKGMYRDIFNILKAIQSEIDTDVDFNVTYPLRDQYGNVEDVIVIKATFKNKTIKKINFDNAVFNNIPSMADEWWNHNAVSLND